MLFGYSPRKKGKYMLEHNSALEVFEKSVGYPLVYTVEQAEHYEMLLISKKE